MTADHSSVDSLSLKLNQISPTARTNPEDYSRFEQYAIYCTILIYTLNITEWYQSYIMYDPPEI